MSDHPTSIDTDANKKYIKIKSGTLARQTSLAMMGQPPTNWPHFDEKFVVLADDRGERLVFAETDAVIRPVAPAALDAAILRYWSETIPFKKQWTFDTQPLKNIRATRDYFIHHAPAQSYDDILPVAFATDRTLAYHRLAFDPTPIEPTFDLASACPVIAEFMTRTSNATFLMTWIGAIFDPDADIQQYVWLVGKGGEGKSTLIRQLARLLGPSFASETPPSRGDRFWTSSLVAKRLIAFADCDDPTFIRTGIFKSLTGNDPMRVEIKNGPAMSIRLNAMVIISSNQHPDITSSPADLRRVGLCSVRPTGRIFENYEKRLSNEMPLFISYCWALYQDHKKQRPNQPIPTQEGKVKELARQNREDLYNVVDYHFATMGHEGEFVTANRVQAILAHYWPNDRKTQGAVRRLLADEYDAESIAIRTGQDITRRYRGLWERNTGTWIN